MALTKISTDGVKDDAVTAGKIPANAVGSSELADNAVDTDAIIDGSVTQGKLANNSVTNNKIASDAIVNSHLSNNSVNTAEIYDEAVTLAKLEHGTSSNDGKFLRANNGADPSFETVSIPAGTTINNNADNRVITGSGTANTLNGESGLTFNGTNTFGLDAGANGAPTIQLQHSGSGNDVFQITGGIAGVSNGGFGIRDVDESAYRLVINSTGKVGIGITNPGQDLVVQNTDDVDYNISTATTNPAIVIKLNSGATGNDKCCGLAFNGPNANGEGFITMVGHSSTEADMRFGMRSGGSRADKVIFASNGRVRMPGVYSTAGSSMRDVQIESDGTLCGLSSITAAKTNITDLTDVSWLYNLKPKTFNFRKKTSDGITGVNTYSNEAETEKSYGLLAEDVETVNKDFCFYDKDSEGNDVLAGVYYKTMVVPLLKAVQELKAENTALTTRVAALEAA